MASDKKIPMPPNGGKNPLKAASQPAAKAAARPPQPRRRPVEDDGWGSEEVTMIARDKNVSFKKMPKKEEDLGDLDRYEAARDRDDNRYEGQTGENWRNEEDEFHTRPGLEDDDLDEEVSPPPPPPKRSPSPPPKAKSKGDQDDLDLEKDFAKEEEKEVVVRRPKQNQFDFERTVTDARLDGPLAAPVAAGAATVNPSSQSEDADEVGIEGLTFDPSAEDEENRKRKLQDRSGGESKLKKNLKNVIYGLGALLALIVFMLIIKYSLGLSGDFAPGLALKQSPFNSIEINKQFAGDKPVAAYYAIRPDKDGDGFYEVAVEYQVGGQKGDFNTAADPESIETLFNAIGEFQGAVIAHKKYAIRKLLRMNSPPQDGQLAKMLIDIYLDNDQHIRIFYIQADLWQINIQNKKYEVSSPLFAQVVENTTNEFDDMRMRKELEMKAAQQRGPQKKKK
jgi:hypothetical protein